jgi:hypothetical protein
MMANEEPVVSPSMTKNCLKKRRLFDDEGTNESNDNQQNSKKRFIVRDNCVYFRGDYHVSVIDQVLLLL